MAKKNNRGEDERTKRRLEAIAGVIGAILAVGTIGVIVWDGISGGETPPIVVVEPLGVHEHDGRFVLEIRVRNRGSQTASQVVVEGKLSREGRVFAASETTFDYVASGSQRRGGLFFAEDPRDYEVDVRALGYVRP